ncbi:hypothetical protein LTR15_009692 [Elasticomyces elasticus]|nr:hypothetical protein LTR15_009692 [Elasticomyces elasticus]
MYDFPDFKLCTVKGPMGCVVRRHATSKELGDIDEQDQEDIWGVPVSSEDENDNGSACDDDEARSEAGEKQLPMKVQRKIGVGDAWRLQIKALSARTARELLRTAAASSDVVLRQVKGRVSQNGSMPPAKKSRRVDGTAKGSRDAQVVTSQVLKTAPTVPKTLVPISFRKRTSSEENEEASAVDALDTRSVYDLLSNASKILPAIHKLGKARFDEVNKAKSGLRDFKGYI